MSKPAEEALADVSQCLQAFTDSHTTSRTLTINHTVHHYDDSGRYTGSKDVTDEVAEKILCECQLCDWARIVLADNFCP